MLSSVMVGGLGMLLFCFFLFNGALRWVDLHWSRRDALVFDVLLSCTFFVQHSWMIRRSFKARLARIIPDYYNDAVFSITSGLVLSAVIILWQPASPVLYNLEGVSRWLARGVFLAALVGMGRGALALKAFDPFGRAPIKNARLGVSFKPQSFAVRGPYLWVRHPLYFFALLLLWSCPNLSLDRFVFNTLWTAWIVVGTLFEEKYLVSDFGDDYLQYQKKVPMLIPWKGPVDKKRFGP